MEGPSVQILVLVAITRVGYVPHISSAPYLTLRTEVENGSVSIAVRHGLVGTKVSVDSNLGRPGATLPLKQG